MKPQVFEYPITVTAQHIDQRQHVNNLVYLEWCLDAAEKHWNHNASKAQLDTYMWYVLSHQITYKAPAFDGQELLLKTWVASNEGVRSERRYEIWNPHENKLLVTTSTVWVLLQTATGRPTAIPEEIRKLFTDDE